MDDVWFDRPTWWMPSRFAPSGVVYGHRNLPDGRFVQLVRRGWQWGVTYRYRFGPFSPLIEGHKFRRYHEAVKTFNHLIAAHTATDTEG